MQWTVFVCLLIVMSDACSLNKNVREHLQMQTIFSEAKSNKTSESGVSSIDVTCSARAWRLKRIRQCNRRLSFRNSTRTNQSRTASTDCLQNNVDDEGTQENRSCLTTHHKKWSVEQTVSRLLKKQMCFFRSGGEIA